MKLLLRHKPKQSLREIKGILYLCDRDELDCRDCPYYNDKGDCHLKKDALEYFLSYEDMERQFSDSYSWRYKCTNCGKEVNPSFAYCPYCGTVLNWEETRNEK